MHEHLSVVVGALHEAESLLVEPTHNTSLVGSQHHASKTEHFVVFLKKFKLTNSVKHNIVRIEVVTITFHTTEYYAGLYTRRSSFLCPSSH